VVAVLLLQHCELQEIEIIWGAMKAKMRADPVETDFKKLKGRIIQVGDVCLLRPSVSACLGVMGAPFGVHDTRTSQACSPRRMRGPTGPFGSGNVCTLRMRMRLGTRMSLHFQATTVGRTKTKSGRWRWRRRRMVKTTLSRNVFQ
jgi:hypothetical protein